MSLPLTWTLSEVRELLAGELATWGERPSPDACSLAPFESAGNMDLAVLPRRASPLQIRGCRAGVAVGNARQEVDWRIGRDSSGESGWFVRVEDPGWALWQLLDGPCRIPDDPDGWIPVQEIVDRFGSQARTAMVHRAAEVGPPAERLKAQQGGGSGGIAGRGGRVLQGRRWHGFGSTRIRDAGKGGPALAIAALGRGDRGIGCLDRPSMPGQRRTSGTDFHRTGSQARRADPGGTQFPNRSRIRDGWPIWSGGIGGLGRKMPGRRAIWHRRTRSFGGRLPGRCALWRDPVLAGGDPSGGLPGDSFGSLEEDGQSLMGRRGSEGSCSKR